MTHLNMILIKWFTILIVIIRRRLNRCAEHARSRVLVLVIEHDSSTRINTSQAWQPIYIARSSNL